MAGVQAKLIVSTLSLSLAGLGVSIYLTVAHFTASVVLSCPENATINCEKVTTSPESYFLGMPVAVLGLAYFVVMVALNSPWAWRAQGSAVPVRQIRVLASVVGIGFVAWLVYAELFKVQAICLWCTSVHIITFILFCLILIGTAITTETRPGTGRVSA